MKCTAAVIGGGPAGLMAAQVLGQAGAQVTVFDAMPTVGRKFLMAGKSGLNLTMDTNSDALVAPYRSTQLEPMVRAFDASAVKTWAGDLGQELFTGSTGRVFPKALKASPLLRAWLARLDALGVQRQVRWRWQAGLGPLQFATPDGPQQVSADVTILAAGGASWARLGSDGEWASILNAAAVDTAPFAPANAALKVAWSAHMDGHMGQPLKGVAWHAGSEVSRGEAVLSRRGLEGGGIYTISRAVRGGAKLTVDLQPDLSVEAMAARLDRPRGKASLANHLRKTLKLDPLKIALAQEWQRPLPSDAKALAQLLKAMPVQHDGLRPMDEAISTAGGVPFAAMDGDLMLQSRPGVFCAGEMLDWEAPTGGYLITACLATGRWAGMAAAKRLGL